MSTSFHEVRFPVDLSYGSSGGPVFDVDIIETKSHLEQRNLGSAYPQATYTTPYNLREYDEYQTILNFYYGRRGKTYGFRYKDWRDYLAVNQSIGSYDGTTSEFQLIKIYGDSANIFTRTIYKPVDGTICIYVDGVFFADWTCDYTTGIVTVTGLTGTTTKPNVITADFEFDVPVRFNNDFPTVAADDEDNLISVNTITFKELVGE